MEKYRVIRDDGLVAYPAVDFISTSLSSRRVPWYYSSYSVPEVEKMYHHSLAGVYEVGDCWMYTHSLLPPEGSDYINKENNIDYQILKAIQSLGVTPEFETHQLTRAQVNCVHKTETAQITAVHRDFDDPGCVYVYYVNDSDGYTILFDEAGNVEAKVMPSAGHLVRMDSQQYHCMTTPVRTDRRLVINLNFVEK